MAVLKTRIGLFRKKQDFAPQTTEEFLRILEDEVDRLSGMVDSLLKLTSLEQVPRTDRIELSELLHQVTEDVSSLFSGKGMHISTEAAPGSIQGSRELLRRALFNLVENAVKYGPEGGEVQIHAEPDGANAAITVSDQGPRIPPELRERIFEPFFRLDTARSRDLGGTGLGLALVRAIAEVHGGSVSVEEGPLAGISSCSGSRQKALDPYPVGDGKTKTPARLVMGKYAARSHALLPSGSGLIYGE